VPETFATNKEAGRKVNKKTLLLHIDNDNCAGLFVNADCPAQVDSDIDLGRLQRWGALGALCNGLEVGFARDVDEAGGIFDPEIFVVSIFDRRTNFGSSGHAGNGGIVDGGVVDGDWCS
jgi:hypothetical protein